MFSRTPLLCQTERWSKRRTGERGIQLGSVARDGDDIWAKTKWCEKQAMQKKGPRKENSQRPKVHGKTSWGMFREDGGGSWCELLWSFGGYRAPPSHSLWAEASALVQVMGGLGEGEPPEQRSAQIWYTCSQRNSWIYLRASCLFTEIGLCP